MIPASAPRRSTLAARPVQVFLLLLAAISLLLSSSGAAYAAGPVIAPDAVLQQAEAENLAIAQADADAEAEALAAEQAAAEAATAAQAATEQAELDAAAEQEAAEQQAAVVDDNSMTTMVDSTPNENGTTCDKLGYLKPSELDRESGDETFDFGRLVWSGNTLTFTAAAGYTVDLCIKGGSVDPINEIDATGSTTYDHPQGISHIGYRNVVLTEPQDETVTATPATVTQSPECDVQGSFLVPTTAGVQYLYQGGEVASGSTVTGPTSGELTAVGADGAELTNPGFSQQVDIAAAEDCPADGTQVTATPATVTQSPECDVQGSFLVPTTAGVQYLYRGGEVVSGSTVTGPTSGELTAVGADGGELTNPGFSQQVDIAAAEDCPDTGGPCEPSGSGSGANGNGNNGFVQLNDTGDPCKPSNEPKLSCEFELEFFGFDEGPNDVTVSIVSQSPTSPKGAEVPTIVGRKAFQITGGGGGNDPNHSETYRLDFTGFEANSKQGFHIQFDVSVDGGNFKQKTVFVEPCPPPPPPPAPAELTVVVDKINNADGEGDFTDSETADEAGQDVDFRALITNTSDVEVLIDSITDEFGDELLNVCPALIGTPLAAGSSALCTFTVPDYAPATGDLENTVTVVVSEPGDDSDTGSDEDTSTVTAPPPVVVAPVLTVAVDKLNDADGDSAFTDSETADAAGQAVDFTANITNTSDVPVLIDSITDVFGAQTLQVCQQLLGTTLAAGDSVTCSFSVPDYAPATGDLVNTVTVVVSEPGDESNTGSDEDTSTVTAPPPVRDLRIVKADNVADDSSVTPGETFGYTLQVFNDGDVAETGFAVTDTLPAGLTLVGTPTGAGFDCAALVCTYTGPAVVPGGSVTLTFQVLLAEGFEGTSVLNSATVPLEGDPTPGNNTDTETTPVTEVLTEVPVRDLEIVKVDDVADGSSVSPGSTFGYTLQVINRGDSAETGFVVTDTLPEGLTLVGTPVGVGFTCVALVCTYTGTAVQPGQAVSVSFQVLLAEGFSGTSVLNSATVPLEGDPTPGNNTDTETTPVTDVLTEVPVRDLQIVKQDTVSSVAPGAQLTYALVVRNVGTAPVQGFTVTDALPAGLSLVSAGGAGFLCSGTTTVSCTFGGTLAPGSTATITLVTQVAADFAGDRIVNTAVVPLDGDPTPGNNTSTETTPVAEVLPTVLTPGPTTPTLKVGPATLVQASPAKAPAAGPTSLPFTGSDTGMLALGALGLLLLGAGAQLAGRRMPQRMARQERRAAA